MQLSHFPWWINLVPTCLVITSALLATGSHRRRMVAFFLVVAAMAGPYLLPESWRATRAIASIAAIAAVIRCSDLVFHKASTTPLRRVAHVLSIADSFRLRRCAPTIRWRFLLRAIVFVTLATLGHWAAYDLAEKVHFWPHFAVRWLGALVFFYSITEVAYATVYSAYRALGFDPGRLHRDPALSRSVREFWGRRWNRIVGAWLDARFFRPLARRGHPNLGMALAFFFSAALHFYIAHPALGTRLALIVMLFFLIQGWVALVEGPLRVARWSAFPAHIWTIFVMVVSSPLMTEPCLQALVKWP